MGKQDAPPSYNPERIVHKANTAVTTGSAAASTAPQLQNSAGVDRADSKESLGSKDSNSQAAGEAAVDVSSLDFSQYQVSALTVDNFDLIKVLGKGSFGKVMLVRKKDDISGTLYAMKTLRKQALVKRNQLAHTATERKILQQIHCPFLVHLVYAFQTPEKLYMVLDYMGGGELFFWLKKDRKFSENRAKLYTAELTLALEAIHSHDIIYRDLKPENILLDLDGHIRITDFGLSKDGITGSGADGGTKTFCGTPEYLAPEILENKGHGKAVDWWALGTLLYEMLCGLPPYYDTNVQRMYQKILTSPLRFPRPEASRPISNAVKDFLRRILERNIPTRLGSTNDATELKETEFLSALDFDRVTAKQYEAEFKPPETTGDPTAASNFDTEFTSEVPTDSVVTSHMTGTMQEKSNFEGFTYRGETNIK
eukprot:CAMPEP_0182429298 /NCGR_PEP_ID=MMETSP1167-20130531/25665_1 /TAXON_ID=2988 /ORGANISM="Mallomonas Sp, Strain CCMP3275" /LENGTH=424 /DNA_ID=CAMNT_0024612733 /DNA_START=89 /DNA_END=1363 /DNA_ORIENTATION=+